MTLIKGKSVASEWAHLVAIGAKLTECHRPPGRVCQAAWSPIPHAPATAMRAATPIHRVIHGGPEHVVAGHPTRRAASDGFNLGRACLVIRGSLARRQRRCAASGRPARRAPGRQPQGSQDRQGSFVTQAGSKAPDGLPNRSYACSSQALTSMARQQARDPPTAIAGDAGRSRPARRSPPWRTRCRPGPSPVADSA